MNLAPGLSAYNEFRDQTGLVQRQPPKLPRQLRYPVILLSINPQFQDRSINMSQVQLLLQSEAPVISISAQITNSDASLHGKESKLLCKCLQPQRSVPKAQKSRSIGVKTQQLLQGFRSFITRLLEDAEFSLSCSWRSSPPPPPLSSNSLSSPAAAASTTRETLTNFSPASPMLTLASPKSLARQCSRNRRALIAGTKSRASPGGRPSVLTSTAKASRRTRSSRVRSSSSWALT